MNLNKRQQAAVRANLALAAMFLRRAEEAGNADQFDKVLPTLTQMDSALFEVRQELNAYHVGEVLVEHLVQEEYEETP